MSIEKLLKPRKICIVGASEKEGFGGDTCRNVVKCMNPSNYFFVNPKRDSVFGIKVYPSVQSVPEDFDLVVICTPAFTVETIIKEASKKGARGVVVYASGYKEVGNSDGEKAQLSLIRLCEELDISLMGPNCAGYVNYIDNVHPFAFISEDRDRKGKVGFVSQSGQLCLSLMDSPNMRFSYSISAGNCAVTEMEDYISFLVDDDDTKVVAIYMEGVNNPKKLADAFRRAALKRKPIVILKAGRSEKGEKIAASHTGSLSGADKIFDALVKKFGVIRVNDLEELLYTAQMFSILPKLPRKATYASMNLSGGETGICADVGELFDINYPDFEDATIKKLKELLPDYASPANPLDMTASLSYDEELYAEALRTVMGDPNIEMVIVGYTLLQEIADPAIKYMAAAMKTVSQEPGAKPIAMLPFVGNTRNLEYSSMLEDTGIALLPPPCYGFRVLKNLSDFISYDPAKKDLSLAIPDRKKSGEQYVLNEFEGKKMIAKYGVPTPKEAIAKTKQEAGVLAEEIGYPIVMKIDSKDILHKSDSGCVKLNIINAEQVEQTFDLIMKNAKSAHPEAEIGGILVQKMAKAGTEIIIGVSSDPAFGPAVLVGLGGVFVEIFQDTALSLAPVSREEAKEMIESLKGGKMLKGYRGSAPCDMEALIDVIMAVSKMAQEKKNSLLELDINPIFVYEKGVCAVDAVVIADKPFEYSTNNI